MTFTDQRIKELLNRCDRAERKISNLEDVLLEISAKCLMCNGQVVNSLKRRGLKFKKLWTNANVARNTPIKLKFQITEEEK